MQWNGSKKVGDQQNCKEKYGNPSSFLKKQSFSIYSSEFLLIYEARWYEYNSRLLLLHIRYNSSSSTKSFQIDVCEDSKCTPQLLGRNTQKETRLAIARHSKTQQNHRSISFLTSRVFYFSIYAGGIRSVPLYKPRSREIWVKRLKIKSLDQKILR